MPYIIRRTPKTKKCYQVLNTKTRRVFSRCSTKENAAKQLRLLRAIQYNKKFVLRKITRRNKIR